LIADALKRSLNLSKQLASYAVVVDAISQGAVRFYRRYGFVEFPDEPMKLYIAMDEIEESKYLLFMAT
jgi:hypothetical protein